MNAMEPWFDFEGASSEKRRIFVEELNKLAEKWLYMGITKDDSYTRHDENKVVVAIDISDEQEKKVLYTWRADYDENRVIVGVDETSQLATNLNLKGDGTIEFRGSEASPQNCAIFVADAFEKMLLRPIERREWKKEDYFYRCWVLSDTNREICWSDSKNVRRKSADLGRPDIVTKVREFSKPH
jgi:hypothetical protein